MNAKNRSFLRLFVLISAVIVTLATCRALALETIVIDIDHGGGYENRVCKIVLVGGVAIDYQFAPEDAVYVKINCTGVFEDGFE